MTIHHNLTDCQIISRDSQFLITPPTRQLPPAEYRTLKAALEGIGGEWSKREQAFVYDDNPHNLVMRLMAGEQINLLAEFKKRTQFFATPEAVLDEMHEYFFVGAGARVLEPSGGDGAICDYLRKHYPLEKYDWSLSVCEQEPLLRRELQRKGYNVVHDDFMTMQRPERGFNLIVANPPFSKDQDVKHIMKMYSMLAPGGRLVSLMRHMNRWTKETPAILKFRAFLEDVGFYSEVPIPAGSFKASGTNIATQFIVLDMPLY